MRSPTLPPPNNPLEKLASNHSRAATRRRRVFIFGFFTLALLSFFYLSPDNLTSTTATLWSKLTSAVGCGSKPMSTSHHTTTTHVAGEGWHARATRTPSTADFAPKASDLVFKALYNSQVEPEGFTMALVKPNLAVDASGHLLTLTAADFSALEAQARAAVSEHVPDTDAFMGQWRVKQARTSWPIDEVYVSGHKVKSVYGWTKSANALELEEETKGRTTLPVELQTFLGLVREARDGYTHGHKDDSVIGKVKDL